MRARGSLLVVLKSRRVWTNYSIIHYLFIYLNHRKAELGIIALRWGYRLRTPPLLVFSSRWPLIFNPSVTNPTYFDHHPLSPPPFFATTIRHSPSLPPPSSSFFAAWYWFFEEIWHWVELGCFGPLCCYKLWSEGNRILELSSHPREAVGLLNRSNSVLLIQLSGATQQGESAVPVLSLNLLVFILDPITRNRNWNKIRIGSY